MTSERAAKLTSLSYNWKLLNGDEEIKRKKQKLDILDEGNKEEENIQSFKHEERESLEKDNLSSSFDNSNSI